MSLSIDSYFLDALRANADIKYRTEKRIYGTAIPMPDEHADNTPVPYIIVTFDGLTNDQGTKDDRFESGYDTVNIGVEVTAKTLDGIHELTQLVRDTILSYFMENDTPVIDYQFAAQQIQYDSLKPCYWQVLTYQCNTVNTNDDERENGQ